VYLVNIYPQLLPFSLLVFLLCGIRMQVQYVDVPAAGRAPQAMHTSFQWRTAYETSYSETKISFMYSQKRNCAASSQFPHSCACDGFIYSHDWSIYFPQQDRQTDVENI
jgi:hypothetical protein